MLFVRYISQTECAKRPAEYVRKFIPLSVKNLLDYVTAYNGNVFRAIEHLYINIYT